MRRVLVIGIGAGNPEYVTIQAVNALNEVDVFFILDKGTDKSQLARLRREICERYIKDQEYRWVEVDNPARDRDGANYATAVEAWRKKRQDICAALIRDELRDGECGAFLVWGDPSLYDGTIPILRQILAEQPNFFEFEVIPGISSVQALAARHLTTLNRIGESIQITTGRRLAEGLPNGVENIVVMLDADDAHRAAASEDVDIYWGAYLGTEDEILVSGKLRELMDEIERVRKEQREKHGWIMDTYLLRRGAK